MDVDCTCPQQEPAGVTRRSALGTLGALGVLTAAASAGLASYPQMSFASGAAGGDVLVFIFCRGGMDGLSVVAPVGDVRYQAARPQIKVPASTAIPLDRSFGMHPAMAPLTPAWRAGQLAFVHAVGDPHGNRSHFDAQDAMERGVQSASKVFTGWIDRHLESSGHHAFPAVAVTSMKPETLSGPAASLELRDINQLRVHCPTALEPKVMHTLRDLHAGVRGSVATAGRETLGAIDALTPLRAKSYKPAVGVSYPQGQFGSDLSLVAQLIKGGVGLRTAVLDLNIWDTHSAMGTAQAGGMHDAVAQFAQALAAFRADLGSRMGSVTVVTMSEFGRTFTQNGSGGTDHGAGGLMAVMGGGIRGGHVYGNWPGTTPQQLDTSGDLKAANDYRDVLGEIVRTRLGNSAVGTVFPGHQLRPLGLTKPR